MIERCIHRFRRGECATCESRESCAAARWQAAFADASPQPAGLEGRPARLAGAQSSPAPFLALLADVAGAVQRHFQPVAASPFRRSVERVLEPLLAGGDIGIHRVARTLGCSRQTLYRRLKAEGTTFEQVLETLRQRLAVGYVRQGLGVKQAAYRLGFSEPAAFSRAFKRWTGQSPSAMRG